MQPEAAGEDTPAASSQQYSPYLAAKREWNERYGSYIKQASNWRNACFGALLIALVSVGGLVYVASQSSVVPYAVELNGHGEVVRVRRADVLSRPDANQIRAGLRTWVTGARSVYGDSEAMRDRIDTTYAMTLPQSPAFNQLADYHRSNNPYNRMSGNVRVSIEVSAVVPISDTTWQVEWRETLRRPGDDPVEQSYQGSFTLVISPPTDERQIFLNPLGIYVKDFAWTRRL